MSIQIHAMEGLPEIRPGDDLGRCLAEHLEPLLVTGGSESPVLAVCQKVVSKAEGRIVRLDSIEPSRFASAFAERFAKDARLVELVLRESRSILRMENGHLIVETHHGFVCANAGIDASNTVDEGTVILLPADPDASASRIRETVRERLGAEIAVIVTDTFGRPWREGQVDVCLGAAGIEPLTDLRGCVDRAGRELHHTVLAVGDALAGAAGLVMEKHAGLPAVLIRGAAFHVGSQGARALLRDRASDLFR